ncbi:MAG TPA: ribonuclease D [Verrucomicrobiales bacterium]|nr:ribonuclease D [Verrucomicrobiales bacterium]
MRPVINTEAALRDFLPDLHKAEWISMDTEADSRHAYPEKVCLLQIGIEDGDFLIDPLAGFDLGPLWEELHGRELIFHGADYDLRLLRRQYGFVPRAVFDTMLAGRLVGNQTFGLRDLVLKYLGVELEKGSQTANWGRRPLTPKMEQYARNDTHFLKPLSDTLRQELESLGRTEWHRETCHQLVEESARPEEIDRDDLWRIKGSSRLRPRGLAVLRAMWEWREQEAIASNKPPYFILPHELLVRFAEQGEHQQDGTLRPPRFLTARRRHGLQAAFEEGVNVPDEQCPLPLARKGRRATDQDMARFDKLKRRRDERAAELDLDPTLIASKAMLMALAQNGEKTREELMAWQRDLLGLG